jgi:HPt (histidine-containing phosphotransfer) domain-containing protein
MNNSQDNMQPIKSIYADDEVIAEILPDFVRNLPNYVDKIRAATGQGDRLAAARVCHDLKGSAGGYGYPQISALAEELEVTLKSGGAMELAATLVEQIATQCRLALLAVNP